MTFDLNIMIYENINYLFKRLLKN